MGCDIHLHIEIKLDGQWEHYGAPNINRWYRLFAKMAGVRGVPSDAIALPKGLPNDMTKITEMDARRWEGDGHSHSWLDIDEIMQLEDWLNRLRDNEGLTCDLEWDVLRSYLFGNSFTGPKRYPADDNTMVEGVRFVFWFDN